MGRKTAAVLGQLTRARQQLAAQSVKPANPRPTRAVLPFWSQRLFSTDRAGAPGCGCVSVLSNRRPAVARWAGAFAGVCISMEKRNSRGVGALGRLGTAFGFLPLSHSWWRRRSTSLYSRAPAQRRDLKVVPIRYVPTAGLRDDDLCHGGRGSASGKLLRALGPVGPGYAAVTPRPDD